MGGPCCSVNHFIAYGFVQQWFKIGGDGRDTNQMSGTFNFTYLFDKRLDPGDAADPCRSIGRSAEASEGRLGWGHRWARCANAEACRH